VDHLEPVSFQTVASQTFARRMGMLRAAGAVTRSDIVGLRMRLALLSTDRFLPFRYLTWALSAVALLGGTWWWHTMASAAWWPLVAGLVFLIGLYDVLQRRHAILRNYPVIGHLRFLFEYIRPEIRQYFIESSNEAAPRACSGRWSTSAPRTTRTSSLLARSWMCRLVVTNGSTIRWHRRPSRHRTSASSSAPVARSLIPRAS
jgi:hypothetical protein